ncbi:MAG: protein-disulfide reductase DsbD domain-containing protein [Bacteroidota bacterium]
MKKIILIFSLTLIGFVTSVNAQIEKPVSWGYKLAKLDQANAILFIKATIDEGWHIYAQNGKSGGPIPTKISFTPNNGYVLVGKPSEPKPIVKFEKVYGFNVNYYENEVIFQQKIKLKQSKPVVKGKIEFMVCNDNKCLPSDEVTFSVPVK